MRERRIQIFRFHLIGVAIRTMIKVLILELCALGAEQLP